jgi:diguanylate cyclase (GGDEF)-like protein
MNDRPGQAAARPDTAAPILVLNHRRDPLDDLLAGLRNAGHTLAESRSLGDTERLLTSLRPAVLILNPLLLRADGIEFELLARLLPPGEATPLLLIVDDCKQLETARDLPVPYFDFLVRPVRLEECLHRLDRALAQRERLRELHQHARELEGQVSIDFKTGLLSEQHFKKLFEIEFKRAQRHQMPLSLLLLDVDNFKGVNDTTEYAFGDAVLRQVAAALKEKTRETDFAARFGGDEFVVLLPQCTPAEAVQTAMRIRNMIKNMVIESGGYSHRVTVSIGIDTFDGRSTTTADELRRRANKALHDAKRQGKDQVWLYSEQPH